MEVVKSFVFIIVEDIDGVIPKKIESKTVEEKGILDRIKIDLISCHQRNQLQIDLNTKGTKSY